MGSSVSPSREVSGRTTSPAPVSTSSERRRRLLTDGSLTATAEMLTPTLAATAVVKLTAPPAFQVASETPPSSTVLDTNMPTTITVAVVSGAALCREKYAAIADAAVGESEVIPVTAICVDTLTTAAVDANGVKTGVGGGAVGGWQTFAVEADGCELAVV